MRKIVVSEFRIYHRFFKADRFLKRGVWMVAHAYEQRQNWFHQSTMLFLVMSCSFSSICGNECGAAANNPTDSSVVSLKSCNKDVTNYLRTLGVSEKRGQHATSRISEEDLILNRLTVHAPPTGLISWRYAPKHRKYLTFDWPGRMSTFCTYPEHGTTRLKRKEVRPRGVTKTVFERIFALFDALVPIGSNKHYFYLSVSRIAQRETL